MDRPDCLSLSYSAARLCCEDSKQMRSLHLLPHHALGKKTNKPTSSSQMVTWIFLALIPKAPPQILLLVITKDESKAGGAKGSLRGSQHQGGWAGTRGKHRRAAAVHGTNACCQCIIPCLGSCTAGHCSASGQRPCSQSSTCCSTWEGPIWRMTGF